METPTTGQQQTLPSILKNELFIDTMLKKADYTNIMKEIVIELQKTIEIIFNLELEIFEAKSEETLSECHAWYQEQMKSPKQGCRTKDEKYR